MEQITPIIQAFNKHHQDLEAKRVQGKLTEGDIAFLHRVEEVMPQYMEQHGQFSSLYFSWLRKFEVELWSHYSDGID